MPPAPPLTSQSGSTVHSGLPTIPPHSLIAFGLFLRLPGYADVLLRERKKAQCLLRLVLGVTDDGDGGKYMLLNWKTKIVPKWNFLFYICIVQTIRTELPRCQ